ncbi:docking protein 2-like isoform X1 [Lampetra planeri]
MLTPSRDVETCAGKLLWSKAWRHPVAQHLRAWRKVHGALYSGSSCGVARLELLEGKDAAERHSRSKEKKIIKMSDCVSIKRNEELGAPRDCLVLRLETTAKEFYLAAERADFDDWFCQLCQIAFPQAASGYGSLDNGLGSKPLEMEENSIYSSADEVDEFLVVTQKTDASERSKLQGKYILKVNQERLELMDQNTRLVLQSWALDSLRRYGKDQKMFTFEAGRRCQTGPGNFIFETTQGKEIFNLIVNFISKLPPGNHGGSTNVDSSATHFSRANASPVRHVEADEFLHAAGPAADGMKLMSLKPEGAILLPYGGKPNGGKMSPLKFPPSPNSEPVFPKKNSKRNSEPVYSEVYDGCLLGKNRVPAMPNSQPPRAEHIYDDPECAARSSAAKTIYSTIHCKDEVQKDEAAPRPTAPVPPAKPHFPKPNDRPIKVPLLPSRPIPASVNVDEDVSALYCKVNKKPPAVVRVRSCDELTYPSAARTEDSFEEKVITF